MDNALLLGGNVLFSYLLQFIFIELFMPQAWSTEIWDITGETLLQTKSHGLDVMRAGVPLIGPWDISI